MNHKVRFFLLWLLVLFAVACGPVAAEPAAVGAGAQPAADCPEPTDGAHLLFAPALGLCFLYPDRYDAMEAGDSGFALFVDSPLNTEAPFASVHVEPANGRTLMDVLGQALPEVDFTRARPRTVALDGVTAAYLDNMPGQDTNRRLIAVHNDRVIDLMIARIGPGYGPVGAEAEALYSAIADSFRFIPVVADAPLRAGPECPSAVADTQLFVSEAGGYCLLLPSGYTVDDSPTNEGGTETAVYVNALQESRHPRLFIAVEEAAGRTLDEVTGAQLAEIEGMTGAAAQFTFGIMIDGAAAYRFDGVPGQDLSRRVVAVHNGRLYTFTFLPDDPTAGPVYDEMEMLYGLVMNTFSFLWN